VLALRSSLQTSRELGHIRLGALPGLEPFPTVEIHKHLTAALLCGRSAAFCRLGAAWRAVCDAEAAVESFCEWGTPHLRLGEALCSAGEAAAALTCFRRAAAFSPSDEGASARLTTQTAAALGMAAGAAPPASLNPEAAWLRKGGGHGRAWLELRSSAAALGLGLGEDLWAGAAAVQRRASRSTRRASSDFPHFPDFPDFPELDGAELQLHPLHSAALSFGGDVGAFLAEQQKLVEASIGVCAAHPGLELHSVLEAGLDSLDHPQRALCALAMATILSWLADHGAAAGFLTRALSALHAVPHPPTCAEVHSHWVSILLCNRSLARLRCGDARGAGEDAGSAVALTPQSARARARAGDACAAQGDWRGAAAHFSSAADLAPPGSEAAAAASARLAVANRNGKGGADDAPPNSNSIPAQQETDTPAGSPRGGRASPVPLSGLSLGRKRSGLELSESGEAELEGMTGDGKRSRSASPVPRAVSPAPGFSPAQGGADQAEFERQLMEAFASAEALGGESGLFGGGIGGGYGEDFLLGDF
jgi:tetratricopeptide (TPR) repeat protein